MLNRFLIVEYKKKPKEEWNEFDELVYRYNNQDLSLQEHKKMESFLGTAKRLDVQKIIEEDEIRVAKMIANQHITIWTLLNTIVRSSTRKVFIGMSVAIVLLIALSGYLLYVLATRHV